MILAGLKQWFLQQRNWSRFCFYNTYLIASTTTGVCVIVAPEMVSRISGPIPPHPCYEKLDAHSQTYVKLPVTGVQHETEPITTQERSAFRLALEGHAMPSTYRHTSLWPMSLLFLCFEVKCNQ